MLMWPVGLPTSVMMAAMRSMTSTRRAEGWRPTTTAPGGMRLTSSSWRKWWTRPAATPPHRPDAVVENGDHHGFGDGRPLLFGKGRALILRGRDCRMTRLPASPTVHSISWGWPEVLLQIQGDFSQGPDLAVG